MVAPTLAREDLYTHFPPVTALQPMPTAHPRTLLLARGAQARGLASQLERRGRRVLVVRTLGEALHVLQSGALLDALVVQHPFPGANAFFMTHARSVRPNIPLLAVELGAERRHP